MAGLVMTLEARIQALEDRAAITDLIASYGPIVDSGDGFRLADMWVADGGEYLIGDEFELKGQEIPELTERSGHQDYLAAGCSHFLSAPTVKINGDEAVAINYSIVLMREGKKWIADRLSANRWDLVRAEEGWRVSVRQNYLLDGKEEARDLLASIF